MLLAALPSLMCLDDIVDAKLGLGLAYARAGLVVTYVRRPTLLATEYRASVSREKGLLPESVDVVEIFLSTSTLWVLPFEGGPLISPLE